MNGTHTSKKKRDVPHISLTIGKLSGEKVYIYRCVHGDYWHTGFTPTQARENFKRVYGY